MKRTALWRRLIETKYGSMWEEGGGAGVLVVCRGLTGLVYEKGVGGLLSFLSSLRWGMVLVLNFGVIHSVRGFL